MTAYYSYTPVVPGGVGDTQAVSAYSGASDATVRFRFTFIFPSFYF